MKLAQLLILLFLGWNSNLAFSQDTPKSAPDTRTDFLIDPSPFKTKVGKWGHRGFSLTNGLVARYWSRRLNGACISYSNPDKSNIIRSVRPEARLTINGKSYAIGGAIGQRNHAYISSEFLSEMEPDPLAFQFVGYELDEPAERFAWGRRRHASPQAKWPPAGKHLRLDFRVPDELPTEVSADVLAEYEKLTGVKVSVHYEMYDGLPAMCKWITVFNGSPNEIVIDRFTAEELALVEHTNRVEFREGVDIPRPDYLHVETDFAFGGFNYEEANRLVVHWRTDPLYSTQVNWARQTPCLLVAEPTYGPSQTLAVGQSFTSFRVFELAYEKDANRERRGLALRKMYRTVAPWVTENPITHHLLTNDPERTKQAIDEAAEVGFEAIILSFGSGFNMESKDPDYIKQWTEVADYAESKGIELGSYSLLSSRNVGKEHMTVTPEGQKPTHGRIPSLASEWGQNWLKTMREFYEETGFDQFENDGPYPGDVDVTARLPLQKGEADSRWVQGNMAIDLYHHLRGKGIYINAPDYYYLNGSNKCGMGYREVNWSLPRAQQVIHTRQNIYDGTWKKTPSMGWMFVPLSQYHGGGAAATIEPLHKHIEHYELMMRSNLGLGVQAHYRGPRLFDTDETKFMVKRVVRWFKSYRDILESDLIHGRRADGGGLDWMLHVNPELEHCGMLCVFNPRPFEADTKLRVNLYYTGISDTALIRGKAEEYRAHQLSRDYFVEIPIKVPANGMSWYVIKNGSKDQAKTP